MTQAYVCINLSEYPPPPPPPGLIIQTCRNNLLQIIKRNGEEQDEVCPEENHYPMFFRPWYIKLDPNITNVYITDSHRSQLTCILTGNVLKLYTYKVS